MIRPDALGDFFLWLPYFEEYLKENHIPLNEVTIIGNSIWTNFADNALPGAEVLSVNKSKLKNDFLYRYKMFFSLARSAEEVHYPVYSKEWDGILLCAIVGSKQRVGWKGDSLNISPFLLKLGDLLFSKLKVNASLFEGDKHANFYDLQGGQKYLSSSWLKGEKNSFAVISPGAGSDKRRWPIENFVKIAQYLEDKAGLEVHLCGGPGEEFLGDYFKNIPEERNHIGKTSVQELVQIVNSASLVISNETGIAQIVDAYDGKGICLLGGGHFKRFQPKPFETKQLSIYNEMECFSCDWNCIISHPESEAFPCISQIEVEKVIQEIDNILSINKKEK